MTRTALDTFDDVAPWIPVASGLARLDISRDAGPRAHALRLDFDFGEGGGFVVARKELAFPLPETWELSFDVRGTGPSNRLELKLVDPSGRNVWWYREEAFALPDQWRRMHIRSSQLEFAWGPAGGGAITEVGAVEFALAAGPGGRGTVWLADPHLEDLTVHLPPIVRSSSSLPGHEPQGVLDRSPATGWRSERSDTPQWVLVDFQAEREYGGLVIHWERRGRARAYEVQTSNDGFAWDTVYATAQSDAERSYVYMPGTSARYLRLDLRERVDGEGFGIAEMEVRPFEFSRSIQTFFRGIAADAHRGAYPRYLSGEQTYWTPIGVSDSDTCALMNQEGMVEVDRATFSIEPFLFTDCGLVTWADAIVTQELEHGYLPIPSSLWTVDGLRLRTTAFAARCADRPVLFIRYRVENTGAGPRQVRLFAACRPLQVTPPWQSFGDIGGASPIQDIDGTAGVVRVNHARTVIPLADADGFGAAAFDQGNIVEHLRAGVLPSAPHVIDTFGYASGALRFDLDLAPSSSGEVYLAIPFGTLDDDATIALPSGTTGADALRTAVREWEDKLGQVTLRLAPRWQRYADTMRTAVAHVLVERDGPALHPGPRRYSRAWIRDGAIMAAALLRTGRAEEAKAFVRWYAPYQAPDGNVPCVVDGNGADWLVEHDSHGELIFAIADCFRFTGDRAFLDELWPNVLHAARYLEALRSTRLGAEFETPAKRAFHGLLPESASHEGYLAHHVHAYWDDFWAVRALADAARLATVVGDAASAEHLAALRDAFRESVRASIATTIATRKIDYVPGSVEWADFDPTATANAISLLGELPLIPPTALKHTFDEYLVGLRRRRNNEIDWTNYTAYEVRIVGALVHLGERAAANELMEFLIGDRRPAAWNQWPEISWRDPSSPGHIGDVPHAWISAEYVLSLRTMLAYERESDQALVVAAGIPDAWLEDGAEVAVDGLVTYWGTLGFTLRRAGADAVALSLRGDLASPPGGVVVRPPLPRPVAGAEVDGASRDDFTADGIIVRRCPSEVVLRY